MSLLICLNTLFVWIYLLTMYMTQVSNLLSYDISSFKNGITRYLGYVSFSFRVVLKIILELLDTDSKFTLLFLTSS